MKTMKILSVLAIVFSFFQCGSSQFVTNPSFEINSAEYQSWVGGQPGVRGLKVKITLKKKSALYFDMLYFRNRSTKIEKIEPLLLIANFNTAKVNPSDIILDIDPTKEMNNQVPKIDKFPFVLKENEAVLSYEMGGETKYYKINDLKKIN